MKQKEIDLFKSLCSFESESFDDDLLNAATPAVLGHLFFNRMQAIAYGTLNKHGKIDKVNREFRNSLKDAYVRNTEKNESFFQCIQHLDNVLSECECKYAMLKGAYLCKLYPIGYRTSNDIDILVHSKDVSEIGSALLKAGFSQGYIRSGKFEHATRRDIIEAKMMRGETVPYIKEIDLPGMKYIEVDVNFSLDFKPGDTALIKEMIDNTVVEETMDFRVKTLRKDDFFVHLCSHLYKEATTMPWIEMRRDMTLYKYCDIYMLLNDIPEKHIDFLFKRGKELGMEKICAFTVLQMSNLFDFSNSYAVECATTVLDTDPDFLHIIESPKEKKKYIYTEKDISKRFFADNRKTLLQEVKT